MRKAAMPAFTNWRRGNSQLKLKHPRGTILIAPRDRRDVANEIEIELVVERRVGRVVAPDHEQRVSVCGRARTTASVPMLLPAPGRFSMMNGWPSRSESHWPISRARMSVEPAGANGTIKRTGRDG
jgi:hypothetical protein